MTRTSPPTADRARRPRRRWLRWLKYLLLTGLLGAVVAVVAVAGMFWYYGRDLPDFAQLKDYRPPITSRIHAGNGRLIAEYAREKRVFVPIDAIPQQLVNGFVAAEDQRFYRHSGIDPVALLRAAATNVKLLLQGRRPIGASTITQQVAKNFLLSNEVSLARKIREAILAFRIEKALGKKRILELYLNEIYLGGGSYGVAAAALSYFDKSIYELTTPEIAYLAALPKAPNSYHPARNPEGALARRNWVIGRMLEEGFLSPQQAAEAQAAPLTAVAREAADQVNAGYFVEEVRRELAARYGEDGVEAGGLSVRTTLNPDMQAIARKALRDGLADYDRRHGWRGPAARLSSLQDWQEKLESTAIPGDPGDWRPAVVLALREDAAVIGLDGGGRGRIRLADMSWARKALPDGGLGPVLRRPADALRPGDVVPVESLKGHNDRDAGDYALRQIPQVDGALVALDPYTGRVLAMVGGWSFARSQFNRATQAWRQPGSAFKPFVYLTALERGYTPATMILDAPFVMEQGEGEDKWTPQNFSEVFYGPSPMRIGIEQSRNLMTVRLAQAVGMRHVVATAKRFGVADHMRPLVAMSLGAGETTLLRLTAAYGMLVNGGRGITPTLIDRVQDRDGRTIFRHDDRPCAGCRAPFAESPTPPQIPNLQPQLADPAAAYQIVTMLEGVIRRGTGRRLNDITRPIAGKTGTTNEGRDAWFVGFTPNLAVGVYVGFDNPTPLGMINERTQETGSSVAAPVFGDFMRAVLKDRPATPFRTPPDIRMVRIDAATGRLAEPSAARVITEAFKAGTEPKPGGAAVYIRGNDGGGAAPPSALPAPGEESATGGLGLY